MDLNSGTDPPGPDPAFDTVPPGDEGAHLSHEGGEFDVYQDLAEGFAGLTG